MRTVVLSAIVGAVGLAALATSTPPFAYSGLDTCDGNPSTVFITVPGVSTVTVHDAPTSTVYLTGPSYAVVQSSGLPATTLTQFYTSTHTNTVVFAPVPTSANEDDGTVTSKITYETTVTKTAAIQTVYLTYISLPASSAGPLSFMVSGGTTYWAGGVSPASTASYVVVTSAVTVVPVVTALSDHTHTTTIHTTIVSGHRSTITKTLSGHSVTSTLVGIPTSAGTAIPFKGVSSGGWNATSGFSSGISVSKPTASNSQPVFITEQSSYDLWSPRSSERLTASAAKSGFTALSTLPASSILTAQRDSPTVPPFYSNSTFAGWGSTRSTTTNVPKSTPITGGDYTYSSAALSSPVSSTQSAKGVFTSSSSSYLNTTSCSESAIKTTGPGFPNVTMSGAATSSAVASTTVSLGGYSNSTHVLVSPTNSASASSALSLGGYPSSTYVSSLPTKSAIGIANFSAASVGGHSNSTLVPTSSTKTADRTTASSTSLSSGHSSIAPNSTALLSSSPTDSTVSFTTSSVPSSFLTMYSSAWSSAGNVTGILSSVKNTANSSVSGTSTSYGYAAGPPSSHSGSVTSSAIGITSSESPSSAFFTTGYAAGTQPSSSGSSTSSAVGVATSLASSSFSVYTSAFVANTQSALSSSSFGSSTSSAIAVVSSPESSTSTLSPPTYAAAPLPSSWASPTSSVLGIANSPSSSLSTVYIPSSSDSAALTGTFTSDPVISTDSSASSSYSLSNTTSFSRTSTSVSSPASATPTQCGETGDFTLNFDDIPPLVATNDTFDTVQPAPVFNPYHQFDFSDGFTVVPPPRDPYFSSSKPLLTEFIPNFNVNGTNTQSGPNTREFGFSGDVGNGDHGLTGCFAFNFYGAAFGCDSRGPTCKFTFTGFRYDRDTKQTNQVAQQGYNVPACPGLQDCALTPVKFTNEFLDLDSIRINVTVAAEPKIWWMDDLQLGWFNNTCAAGLCRMSTHIH